MGLLGEKEALEAVEDAEGWLNASCPYYPRTHLSYEVDRTHLMVYGTIICQICHYARFSESGKVSECAIWMGRRPNDIYADIDLR